MRKCGECSVCCVVSEIDDEDFKKLGHVACKHIEKSDCGSCSIYGSHKRPIICGTFQCGWLAGYGKDEDRPDKSGLMISRANTNGGEWIFVIETKKDALRLKSGVEVIREILLNYKVPVIVSDYGVLPPNDTGNRIIIHNSILDRSSRLIGDFLFKLSDELLVFEFKPRAPKVIPIIKKS